MLNKDDYELANPNVVSLIQSLRAFGYDISTAIVFHKRLIEVP